MMPHAADNCHRDLAPSITGMGNIRPKEKAVFDEYDVQCRRETPGARPNKSIRGLAAAEFCWARRERGRIC
jgi:hypothetical protein